MLSVTNSWTSYIVLSALTVSVLGIFIWNKKRRNYAKVGRIRKLFFYPVKSLKGVEVTKGTCAKVGFEVNGVLDRSFMLVDEDGNMLTQETVPSVVLLTPHITSNYMIISGPNTDTLKVEIKKSPSPTDRKISCKVGFDVVEGTDCGSDAASWFQSYLNMKGVRLVRFFNSQTDRKYTKRNPFYRKLREKQPIGFQNLSACHILSQASVDDLNSRLEEGKKISVYNFRPNIVVEGCEPFAEDSWKYLKFDKDVELTTIILTARCLQTTTDQEKGILNKKEPLVTLRKYRIADDPMLFKILGSVPCMGTHCDVISPGEISVGDEIFAVVEQRPKMKEKST